MKKLFSIIISISIFFFLPHVNLVCYAANSTPSQSNEISPNMNLTYHTIYVSSSTGNDSNSGISIYSPLKTINKALSMADNHTKILLKCNDTFFLSNSITLQNIHDITLSSYGNGNAPKVCGLQELHFVPSDTNDLYKCTLQTDIGFLFYGGDCNWQRILSPNTIKNDGDFFISTDNTLYLLSHNFDYNSSVYGSSGCNGITISNNCANIVISNLEICCFGKHGIIVSGNSSNVYILNNHIHHIGGALFNATSKYGNGIEFWMNGITNIYAINNTVHNCYDAGITPQVNNCDNTVSSNIHVSRNEVFNCYYLIEYFHSVTQNSTCKNIYIENNYLHDAFDITNGYRENSDIWNGAFLCMRRSIGAFDSVYVNNNLCINCVQNSLVFLEDSHGRISINNNIFISTPKNKIKNPAFCYESMNRTIYLNEISYSNSLIENYINTWRKST